MPKVSDVYSGSGLKADIDVPDLEDGGLVVTIKGSEFKEFDDGPKIIVRFKETDKSLILNKTNADTLVKLTGSDDTDDWVDYRIKLYATDTTYQGKPIRGIRVHSRPPGRAKQAQPAPAPGGRDFDETDGSYDPPPRRKPPGEDAAAAVDSMEV